MNFCVLFRKALSWLARLTAKLAAKWHPHLVLKSDVPTFTFCEDGLATVHNSEFLVNERFQRAYSLGKQTGSWHNHDLRWRIHVLLWCATWAAQCSGAFVECGVYRGGFARAIIDYINFESLNKTYYLFDTFAGFDHSQFNESERRTIASNYHYEDTFNAVRQEFSSMTSVRLVRGSIPESLVDVGSVAFLSIDMNCVVPEIAAAKFYWPHMSPGAVMVLDDYGFTIHHQQKLAFDQLAKEWNVEILSLPTGQGLIFKPGMSA
jgi:O-methyltransferase